MKNNCQILLKWVRERDSWHMYDKELNFIQEFYDCKNMRIFFRGLEKERNNWYFVRSTKLDNEDK